MKWFINIKNRLKSVFHYIIAKREMHTGERFPLKKQTSQESIQAIYAVTNGKINLQYIAVMLETIQKRKHTWFSFLDASLHEDLIKQIIGKDGSHFKNFTTKYGVDLIWNDRATNRILLWGPKMGLISALYALQRHLKRFTTQYEEHIAAVSHLDQTMTRVRLREEDTNDYAVEQPIQKKTKRA
jgi:hypothetical protein